jgi:lipid-binding SYLF domain-containing protein
MKTPLVAALLVAAALAYPAHPLKAGEQSSEAAELTSASKASLQSLMATVPAAKALASEAEAVLVFPKITKAGLGIGGQYGEGALLKKGSAVAYYKTTGASFGLQVGGQQYGYAMFFMNAKALSALDSANGFEIGVGPSVVVMDEGMAKSTTTTTRKDDVYALIFGQKGLMAGLGLQGNKITKITP